MALRAEWAGTNMIEVLAHSFEVVPVAPPPFSAAGWRALAGWGGEIFLAGSDEGESQEFSGVSGQDRTENFIGFDIQGDDVDVPGHAGERREPFRAALDAGFEDA